MDVGGDLPRILRRLAMPRCITIFTDTSFCHKTKAGGWAAWIKYDGGTLRKGAPVRGLGASPTHCELIAIRNALHYVEQGFRLTSGDLLVIQTDCLSAIQMLEGNIKIFGRAEKDLVDDILKWQRDHFCCWSLQHVKGHMGTSTRRSAVNTWCDEEAGRHMRTRRQQLSINSRPSSARGV